MIGIIGVGMVGTQVAKYFADRHPLLYDINGKYNDDISKANLVFICVPTDINEQSGVFDVSNLRNALKRLSSGSRAVIKSTVLPGTCRLLQKEFPDIKIFFNPEFLTEATAYENFTNPQLQIVGGQNEDECETILHLLPVAKRQTVTNWENAEAIKIIRNTLSAVQLVALNEIYDQLQRYNISYETGNISIREGLEELAKIPSYHLKVIHKKGRGAGGKCLKKDLWAMSTWSESAILQDINKKNLWLLKNYPKE